MEAVEIQWCKALRSIAQRGLNYANDFYDVERYKELKDICDEMTSYLAGKPLSEIQDFFVGEEGHPTPKVDLRGAVFRDGKIMMVKETSDNKWSLPGGWAEVNEAPSEGVVREIKEESGFEVKVIRMVALKDRSLHGYTPSYPFHIYKLFFLCEITGGKATVSHETNKIDFFDPEDLPEISIDRILAEDIEMMVKAAKDDTFFYFD